MLLLLMLMQLLMVVSLLDLGLECLLHSIASPKKLSRSIAYGHRSAPEWEGDGKLPGLSLYLCDFAGRLCAGWFVAFKSSGREHGGIIDPCGLSPLHHHQPLLVVLKRASHLGLLCSIHTLS